VLRNLFAPSTPQLLNPTPRKAPPNCLFSVFSGLSAYSIKSPLDCQLLHEIHTTAIGRRALRNITRRRPYTDRSSIIAKADTCKLYPNQLHGFCAAHNPCQHCQSPTAGLKHCPRPQMLRLAIIGSPSSVTQEITCFHLCRQYN
jgi:hypothetical protein